MVHLSKNQLSAQELGRLFLQLNTIASKLSIKSSETFFSELLGSAEKIMLTKRLAAIVMFMEGNSAYRVWQLLKISPSTADRIRLNYEIGMYDGVKKILKANSDDYTKFWETLEIILRAGMPPRGRGRWKSVMTNDR